MAGHSAIDAEAEANYAKDSLNSGLSAFLVAFKIAKNLAFGTQEMLARCAVFEWSYKLKGDHLVTPEGDRFSKLIATEGPQQRAILQSVERDFVNDPSVRQKIVVSVDNPTENSPDAQRRSYIYIYTRHGDEIRAQSIESFADAKALRVLLKQLGCNDQIRAVEDGKVLIEPTSVRDSRGYLTLERVAEATRRVTEMFPSNDSSRDLADRLDWYIQNRDMVIKKREEETAQRAAGLLKNGEGGLVDLTRKQAADLNSAIVGGQVLAQQLYRQEHKNTPPPQEFVRVTRPQGLSVVGAHAHAHNSIHLDRISVLGWGNMARWAELLGLSIPSRQSGARGTERAPYDRRSYEKGGRGTSFGSRSSASKDLSGLKRDGIPHEVVRGNSKLVTSREVGAHTSKVDRAAQASVMRGLLEKRGRGNNSSQPLKDSQRLQLRGGFQKNELGIVAPRGLARLRMELSRLFQKRVDRGNQRIHGARGDTRRGGFSERLLRVTRRLSASLGAPRRSSSTARGVVRIARSQWRHLQTSIVRRSASIRRSLLQRVRDLAGRARRSTVRGVSRVRSQGALRQRGFRSVGGVARSRPQIRVARAMLRARVFVRGVRRGVRGERVRGRMSSSVRTRFSARSLLGRFASSSLVRRVSERLSRIRPQRQEPLAKFQSRQTERFRLKVSLGQAVPRSVLVFVEWLLRQSRAPRNLLWIFGAGASLHETQTTRVTDENPQEDDLVSHDLAAPLSRKSDEALEVESVVHEEESQEPLPDVAVPLISAQPRWELSIFTARQFDSPPSDGESASFAA